MVQVLTSSPARGWAALPASAIAAAAFAGGFFHVYATSLRDGSQVAPWAQNWDQSQYLRSAQSFANLDFASTHHLYPPLYALLAAPFTSILPYDPFVVIDALSLAGSTILLVLLFGRLIGYAPATCFAAGFLGIPDLIVAMTAPLSLPISVTLAIIFFLWLLLTLVLAWATRWVLAPFLALAFVFIPELVVPIFVQPWTSTLATLLVLLALWQLMRLDDVVRPTIWASFLFSATLGLLLATRPLDAVAAVGLYPFWLVGILRTIRKEGTPHGQILQHLAALTAGGMTGLAILFGSNILIHGTLFSPYMGDMVQSFTWSALPRKFVSLFFDSASLYVEPAQVILRKFPWALAGFFAVPVCMLRGPLWLKAAALLVILTFVLYLPFNDLLPNGLYRYYNYHYFRGSLWLVFMLFPAAVVLLGHWLGRRAWWLVPPIPALTATIACLQLQTSQAPAPYTVRDDVLTVELPSDREIAFADIGGVGADWESTYFSDPRVALDDRMLVPTLEVRAVPTEAGTRLVFTRPISGRRLTMPLQEWRHERELLPPMLGSYAYTLGFPAWLALP